MAPETEERLEMRRMERKQTMGQFAICVTGAFCLWLLEGSASRLALMPGVFIMFGFAGSMARSRP